MLWHNTTGVTQVFYDGLIEPLVVRPQFALNDLELGGAGLPCSRLAPLGSLSEIMTNKPDARVCLVRVSSLGDILLLAPTFRRIRDLFPSCELYFASTEHYASIFRHVDFVSVANSKFVEFEGFDFGYDFDLSLERAESNGWGRSLHRSAIFARLLGLELTDYTFNLPYSEDERKMAKDLLDSKRLSPGPLVALQIRGANPSRSLPVEKVRKITTELVGQGVQVALLDADQNIGWEEPGVLNLCGQTGDVLLLAAVVDQCDFVITTDSGLTHLSGVLGKRNLAFFGCTPARNRVAYPNCRVVDLAKAWGCDPCWQSGERCGQTWGCMSGADEALFLREVREELNGTRPA